MPDALAWDGDAVTVLYVEPGPDESAAQRAARVDVRSGARDPASRSPPRGISAHRPAAPRAAATTIWMVAAVSIDARGSRRVGDGAAPRVRAALTVGFVRW
ncbi:MAG: hypothetical protein U0325_29535 [Polyangiales bacterium]